MKKILIATDNYLPRWDGIARFLSEVIPRLQERFEIAVIAPNFGELEEQKGYKLVRFPLNKHLTFGDFTFARPDSSVMRKLIRDSDIVFTQTIGPIGAKAIKLASALRKPCVAFIHSIEYELAVKAMKGFLKKYAGNIVKNRAKKLYNKCDLILVPSEDVEELLHWQNITTPSSIVHLGVNPGKFSPPENKQDAKQQIGLDPSEIIIGYHGRIAREKDLLTLFRAFIRLQSKYKEIKLLMVGDGVKEIVDMFKKRHGVIVVSAKRHVQEYLEAMDIYVLTSLTETTSLGTLEAMSCELPVIATRVGFVKDYIIDGINGFLIDKKQPYQLMKKIENLIEDSYARKRIGKEARKSIIKKFSRDNTVKRISELFDDI